MFNSLYQKKRNKRGFTLIELIVAIALFGFVSVAAVSAMLAVVDGNKKSQSLVSAMGNLNFAMESMTRELRVGRLYDCGAVGGSRDCTGGDTRMTFSTSDSGTMTYRLTGTSIERVFNNGFSTKTAKMTGSDVVIDELIFYVRGTTPGDSEQPKVTIVVEGTAGVADTASNFILETTVTQRFPDI